MSGPEHWSRYLYQSLTDPSVSDDEILEIIESEIPADEGKLAENKRKMFIGSDETGEKKEREYDFVRHVCALANVPSESEYRYIFIGFSDDRRFIGIDNWGANGGQTFLEIDDADLQNVIDGSLQPPPDIERHTIDKGSNKAVVIIVRRSDSPPVIATKRTAEGNTTYLEEGVGYIRKGSKSRKMRHSDFRVLIQRREEIISDTFESIADDLNQIVGIPSDQLSEMDLTVSPNDEGPPVREVLNTDAADGINGLLTVSAKNWNSSGELITDRRSLYEYYKRRSSLELNDVKLECLIRSFWYNYLPGYLWIEEYLQSEQSLDDIMSGYIENDMDGNNYRMIEAVCFMLGSENALDKIDSYTDFDRSRASEMKNQCQDSAADKIDSVVTRNTVEVGGEVYTLEDIVNQRDDGEAAIESLIDQLLEEDSSLNREKFRSVELAMLGRLSGIVTD